MIFQNTADNQSSMDSTNFLYKNLHGIFISVYVFILCKTMISCYRIKEFNYLYIFILFISGILIYKLYSILSTKVITKPAVFLLLFSAVLLLLKRQQLLPLWNTYIIQNFNSINLCIYTESETYFHQFLPFLVLFIPLTTAICFILSAKGKAHFSIFIFSIYLFSFWNNGLDKLMSKYIPYYVVLSLLYFSLCMYQKTISSFGNSDTKVNITGRNILLCTLFTSVSIILLVSASIHMFGSKSIVQIRSDYEINEAWMVNSSKKAIFDMSNTGYGSYGGKLGGPVNLNTLIAIKVKADQPAYLRGSVKDYYDGHSWSKSTEGYTIPGKNQLEIQSEEFNLRMTGSINEKPEIRKMSIYHYGLATSTLFAPNNTLSINAKDGKVMHDSFHAFMLMGKDTVSEPYTLKYYFSKTGIERFELLKESKQRISYNSNSPEVKKVYIPYLQVPQSISQRTYELVNDIIKDCTTTEDKVERIMSYLSFTYPYSLDVSQVPEDTDFIDYFLFNEKKGYCTYFASAATIIFRIAGIPARYVEGFNMDGEKDSSGFYIVRNHKAHTWTEILVSSESNLWCIADCAPQGAQVSDISKSAQYIDKFADDRYKSGDNKLSDIVEVDDNNILQYYNSFVSILLYPLIIVPSSLFLLLLVYIIYRLVLFKGKINKILELESNIPFYGHLVSRLKATGVSFPPESCELEYVKSIENRELSKQLEKVVKACYLECYGGIGDSAFIDKRACNKLIEKHMRKKAGFLKYWYCIIRYF